MKPTSDFPHLSLPSMSVTTSRTNSYNYQQQIITKKPEMEINSPRNKWQQTAEPEFVTEIKHNVAVSKPLPNHIDNMIIPSSLIFT